MKDHRPPVWHQQQINASYTPPRTRDLRALRVGLVAIMGLFGFAVVAYMVVSSANDVTATAQQQAAMELKMRLSGVALIVFGTIILSVGGLLLRKKH